VLLVAGVGHGDEEGGIALGTADVLRRAGVLSVQADGEAEGGILGQPSLDGDPVLPSVPEVVFVDEVVDRLVPCVERVEEGGYRLITSSSSSSSMP
jgi:hypothetical protein